jgi:hypothetical protein
MSDDNQVVSTPKVTVEPVTNLETTLSLNTDATFQMPHIERHYGPLGITKPGCYEKKIKLVGHFRPGF